MRKRLIIQLQILTTVFTSVCVTAACAPSPSSTATPTYDYAEGNTENSADISGLWIGGFGPVELFAIDIQPGKDGFNGRIRQFLDSRDTTVRPLTQTVKLIDVKGANVVFTVVDGSDIITFDGTVDGGMITATSSGSVEGDFELHRVVELDDRAIRAWEGVYQMGDDPVALYRIPDAAPFAPLATFWIFNLNTGTMRALYPLSDDELLVGAGLGIATKSEGIISAKRSASGRVEILSISRDGRSVEAQRVDLATEDVTFQSGELKLAGRITLPQGSGPHPAVVITHGSEPGDRDTYRMMAAMYATHGVAAFSYDKRGVGDSDGAYVEDATESNIANLASDAIAAVDYVRTRRDIIPHLIGLAGGSQAGWTIPEAAAQSQDVAFVIITSGPVISTYEESAWSAYTNDGATASGRPLDELEAEISNLSPLGLNSAPFIQRLRISGLWVFGTVDRSVPARKSVENLTAIKQQTGADFTIVLLDNADHNILNSPDGMTRSLPFSNGFAPEYFKTIQDWLASHVILAGP